ncbi:interleukin-4 [Pimephales promelas]|nr:interleukin-4 [Pimephales promelas]
MDPSMRTFLLLALTLVAVNGSKPNVEKILLREIIESVEKILNNSSAKKENLCQAEMVLKNTHLNQTKLHRNLRAYAKHTGVSHRPIFIH